MKIVLTGSTGFAGSEVLQQCIQSQDVNSIIVLTRRPLNMTQSDAKVNNIIFEDFESYSPQTIEAISDADACIWCLGGTTAEIEVNFPAAFTNAMTRSWTARKKPFRYIHCSGILAERDQMKSLWFMQEGRRAKGRAETQLLHFAQSPAQQELWQTYIMRPSMIMPKEPTTLQRLLGQMLGSVRVDELATAALSLASRGHPFSTLENDDLVVIGKQVHS